MSRGLPMHDPRSDAELLEVLAGDIRLAHAPRLTILQHGSPTIRDVDDEIREEPVAVATPPRHAMTRTLQLFVAAGWRWPRADDHTGGAR